MLASHQLKPDLLTRTVQVLLVGAGGTGSQMISKLVNLHRAMCALGHPGGLHVTVVDPDVVSGANIGRQNFYPGDVGSYKADVLVNRANMALETVVWDSICQKLNTKASLHGFDMVIGAVDNRAARLGILRGLESPMSGVRYWLDMGNRKADGQVILGQVTSRRQELDKTLRLPHAGELFPELIDPKQEDKDDTPSCSLAEALEKQSLFINPMLADCAGNIVWQLFTKGSIDIHGAFVNLYALMVMPIRVDPEIWARFGVKRDGRRHPVKRLSAQKKQKAIPA